MRSWYVSKRNEAILNKRLMALFAGALILVLFWLLPREQTFRDMLALEQADRVSIAYAKLLLSLNPDDEDLAQLLAGQYYQLGDWNNAWTAIKDQEDRPSLLAVRILQKITYGYEPGSNRTKWQMKLSDAMSKATMDSSLDSAALGELALLATSLNHPRVAAGLYERIYERSNKPDDLIAAANAWIAADVANQALSLLLRDDHVDNEALTILRIRAALATGNPKLSLGVVDTYAASLTLTSEPSAELVLHLARALLANNLVSRVPEFLDRVHDLENVSLDVVTALGNAALASGSVTAAKRFIERAYALRNNDPKIVEQLAKVYEWSGDPDLALKLWLQASELTSSEIGLSRAWRLSRDLFQYQNVAVSLSKLAEQRRLSNEEVTALRWAWEQHGTPIPAIESLQQYLKNHRGHRQAWLELIAVQTNDLQLANASSTWTQFARLYQPTISETRERADTLWRQYRPEAALDVLLASERREHGHDYWLQLGRYALFLDKLDVAARAFERRLELGESLGRVELDELIHASGWEQPGRVAVHAMAGWRKDNDRLDLLRTALYALFDNEDYQLANELFDSAMELPSVATALESDVGIWNLRSNLLQLTDDLDGAQVALDRALALAPENVDLQTSRLWLMIAREDNEGLLAATLELGARADNEPTLWSPLASALAMLGQHQSAVMWFHKAVHHTPQDLGLVLAYSGTLDVLGAMDPAYRLRRHVLEQIARQAELGNPAAIEVNPDSLAAISFNLMTAPRQRDLLRQILSVASLDELEGGTKSNARQTTLRRFDFADALRRAHYSAARYWLNTGVDANSAERLAVAADEYDETELAFLADSESFELGAQAAIALGEPEYAQSLVAAELRRNPNNAAARTLLESLETSLTPTSWQVSPIFESLGNFDFRGVEFIGARNFDHFRFTGELRHQRAQLQVARGDPLPAPPDLSELGIRGVFDFDNRLGAAALGIGYAAGNERALFSIDFRQQYRLDRRNSFAIALEHGTRLSGGGISQALLSRSGVQFDWNNELSSRLRVNSNFQTGSIFDQDGGHIGNVTQFTVAPEYLVFRGAPTISLRGQALWSLSGAQTVSGDLQPFLRPPDQAVLPADFRQLTVGAVIARDQPGELGWQHRGLHYRLSADVGYRWPQQNFTFTGAAAVAVPILGRDRLSASVNFTNSLDNQVDEKGISAQLTYTRQLH